MVRTGQWPWWRRRAKEGLDGVLVSNGTVLVGPSTGPDEARARRGDRFDPNGVGLDHLALGVASRAGITAAARRFDERGIPHGDIAELGADFRLHVMMAECPDGIQVEPTFPYTWPRAVRPASRPARQFTGDRAVG